MTAFRWNWVAPWQEDQDEIYKNELLGQAEQIDNFFANNPSIPYNMSEISKTYGFLPKDVQVAGALMGLTRLTRIYKYCRKIFRKRNIMVGRC